MNKQQGQEEALARPGMMDCAALAARLSERQCLFNQRRHKVEGAPLACGPCVRGAAIREKHAGGMVPDRQFNVFKGGFVARPGRKVELAAAAPVCLSKRLVGERREVASGQGSVASESQKDSPPRHKETKGQEERNPPHPTLSPGGRGGKGVRAGTPALPGPPALPGTPKAQKRMSPSDKEWWTAERRAAARKRIEARVRSAGAEARTTCFCGAPAYGKAGVCFEHLLASVKG